jgi:hypothetical protein
MPMQMACGWFESDGIRGVVCLEADRFFPGGWGLRCSGASLSAVAIRATHMKHRRVAWVRSFDLACCFRCVSHVGDSLSPLVPVAYHGAAVVDGTILMTSRTVQTTPTRPMSGGRRGKKV